MPARTFKSPEQMLDFSKRLRESMPANHPDVSMMHQLIRHLDAQAAIWLELSRYVRLYGEQLGEVQDHAAWNGKYWHTDGDPHRFLGASLEEALSRLKMIVEGVDDGQS